MEKIPNHRPGRALGALIALVLGAASTLAGSTAAERGFWSERLGAYIVPDGRDIVAVGAGGNRTRLARAAGPIRGMAIARETNLVAVIASGSPNAVSVYRFDGARLRLAGGGVEAKRQPVRVSWGDVDADGNIEALVLVTGRARFDRRLALRPFVYGWDGSRLYPRWLGSRLSRPFDDATLGDLDADGRAELVAIEHTRDSALELASYRWRGFGFERIATSGPHAALSGLNISADGKIEADADGIRSRFAIDGERIVPEGTTTSEAHHPPPPILDARTTLK